MPCTKDEQCPFCTIQTLRRLLLSSERCSKRRKDWQYAAINSYTSIIGLPIVPRTRVPYTPSRENLSCVSELSPVSTLLSVCCSLSHMFDFIHFGRPDFLTFTDLISITDSCRMGRSGATFAIEFSGGVPSRLHSLGGENIVEFDSRAASMVYDTMSDSSCISWYWDDDSTPHVHMFPPNPESLWISYNSGTGRVPYKGPWASSRATGVALHSDPSSGSSVVVGTGSPVYDFGSLEDTELESRIKNTAAEFLETITKDGKCYSCSIVCRIHDHIRHRGRPPVAPPQPLKLSERFSGCLERPS